VGYEYECYQKDQLLKEMLLLENHLTTFRCQHCIRKHRLTIVALAEETYKITPKSNEKGLLRKIIQYLDIRRVMVTTNRVRYLRKQLMKLTPLRCRTKI